MNYLTLVFVILAVSLGGTARAGAQAAADNPYREGVKDYYSGLCYRARPYQDGPEQKARLWERGFNDAERRDRGRLDRSHCNLR